MIRRFSVLSCTGMNPLVVGLAKLCSAAEGHEGVGLSIVGLVRGLVMTLGAWQIGQGIVYYEQPWPEMSGWETSNMQMSLDLKTEAMSAVRSCRREILLPRIRNQYPGYFCSIFNPYAALAPEKAQQWVSRTILPAPWLPLSGGSQLQNLSIASIKRLCH